MKKLVVRISIISLLLLIGASFGVQVMNEELGISWPVPLIVEETENSSSAEDKAVDKSKIVITSKIELAEKSQKVEEVGRFNFFSDMGSYLAEGMNYASRSLLSQVMSFVNNVLNGNGGDK
ncbi:hypothetical protein [Alkalihalobacillus deserti]|uniref:hypothetical protein n=1 Tax=Alkalihalobacillus deserti TaxID=2879466 RepID=UPI001D144918|nr:hypothetical protein [Alkalihalobacillus deserti]